MTTLRVAGTRFSAVFRRAALEQDLEDELRFHLRMRAQEHTRRGMTPTEAARQARLDFGNLNSIKDACRDVSGAGALAAVWDDVCLAARMLVKSRGFNAMAALTLALAIAANVVVFTITSSVVLRPLPFPDSDRLMAVRTGSTSDVNSLQKVSYLDFLDYRTEAKAFDALGAFYTRKFIAGRADGSVEHVQAALVSPELFPLLGVQPALGRFFTAEEDAPGNRAVIISDALWRRSFAASEEIAGATLTLDGQHYHVVGVMPPAFRFPIQNAAADVWTTLSTLHESRAGGGSPVTSSRDNHYFQVVGRLKDGSTRAEAEQSLRATAARLAALHPLTNRFFDSASVAPWRDHIAGSVRQELVMLGAAALCLLAVACANVANLLLAQSSARDKHTAIRAALGGARGRLLRQLLIESVLLAAIGGIAGVLLAAAATPAFVAMLPADFPRIAEISIDWRVVGFTGAIALVACCMFAPLPAWRSARVAIAPLLNESSRGNAETMRSRRFRNALVATEIVLAFVLLSGAAIFIDGLQRLRRADPGFDARGVVTLRVVQPENRSALPGPIVASFAELLQRVAGMPGVESVAASSHVPFTGRLPVTEIIGAPKRASGLPMAAVCTVTPGYFETLRISLIAGREFDGSDGRQAVGAVILNESLARELFGSAEHSLGKIIRPKLSDDERGHIDREVVGVVADVQWNQQTPRDALMMYVPHRQFALKDIALLVRTDAQADAVLPLLRDLVANFERGLLSYQPGTLEGHLETSIARPRLNSAVLGVFAALALVLTAIGVFGVVAYSVTERRNELGIRLALGAQRHVICRLVLAQGARLISGAIVLGGICAFVAVPLFRRFTPAPLGNDLLVVIAVGLFVSAVALLACWIPARRAAKLDPLAALAQR